MPHPNNSMREVASTSADGDHSEPQEFQDQETVTENRHTNYGMHELPPLEPKKDSGMGKFVETVGNKIGNEGMANYGHSKRVEKGLEEQEQEESQ